MNKCSNREAEIFTELLQLPPERRDTYLKQACGGDVCLSRKVKKLLEAHDKIGDFLNESPQRAALEAKSKIFIGEKPGDCIGRYKLLQQIGEGGCGIVFMAEQKEPIHRRVALKIIKPGMDTKNVIARFEAERQALALMDHPNIAKMFDAGATESGRPYFVMELVRGIKITEFCDQHLLTIEDRMKLFIQVCHAVQHAHQKGIIHRDIKPSNILVTNASDGTPMPIVIDFGIAKATTNQQLTSKTLFTAFEMLIGTPAYMSPEQATLMSIDVDTRTDIYSLGVLLYELLTGSPPFDTEELQKVGLDEIRRKIREEEPLQPSTMLSRMRVAELTTVAQRHRSDPPILIRTVRGDLDWIVMKAIEKDRARRYQTAYGMALDVQHFLANEPVTARPASTFYKFQKTLVRNKLLCTGIGLISVLFVASFIVVSLSLAKERQSHREAKEALLQAEADSAKSQQVTKFLEDMLQGVGPSVARGRDTTMLREILDRTAKNIAVELTNQPAVEAQLRALIGELYFEIGEFGSAENEDRAADGIEQKLYGAQSPESGASLHNLGTVLFREGKLNEAENAEAEALSIRQQLFGEENSDVASSLDNLACIYTDEHRLDEAEHVAREALGIRRKLFGSESLDVAGSLHTLCVVLEDEGKKKESETVAREAVAVRQKLAGKDDTSSALALYDLAWAEDLNGRVDEGESLGLQTLAVRRKLLGDAHPDVARNLSFLGQTLGQQGQLTAADAVLSAAYSIQCKVEGENTPDTLYTLDALAYTFGSEGKWAEAEAADRKSMDSWRKREGNHGERALYDLHNLISALVAQKKFGEAEDELNEVLTPDFLSQSACSDVLWQRIDLMGRQAKWSEAIADMSRLIKYQPNEHYNYHVLFALLVITQDRSTYEQLCPNILTMFANTSNAYVAQRVADACLLLPNSGINLRAVGKLADKAIAIGGGDDLRPYVEACKALSEYRSGHFAEAIKWAGKPKSQVFAQAQADAVLAMAQWRLGRKNAALAALAQGNILVPEVTAEQQNIDLGGSWTAWLYARIPLNEAAALIQAGPNVQTTIHTNDNENGIMLVEQVKS